MNYLQKLKADKAAREHYESDSQKLKELVFDINDYHAAYDGEFLKELEEFMAAYKQKKLNEYDDSIPSTN